MQVVTFGYAMKPPFNLTNTMLNQIVLISQQIGRLELAYQRQLHLQKDNRLRSIQSSLAIENNSLTLTQVTDIINGKRVHGNPREIQEVKNTYDAYEQILQFDPYSINDFLTAHGMMTKGLTDHSGAWRQGDIGIYDSAGNLIHMGARPQFVPKLMMDLFNWAKTDDTPILIKSTVMHYEIEVIHPFSDGNRRMGRLWQTVLLSLQNPVFAWLPVETIVYENQAQYYAILGQAGKTNNATVFIEFMLDAILNMVNAYINEGINKNFTSNLDNSNKPNSTNMSDKLVVMSDKNTKMGDKLIKVIDNVFIVSDKLSKLTDNEKQAYLLISDFLKTHSSISNSDAQILLNKSASTVRRYLNALVQQELLIASGERKARKYRSPHQL